MFPSHTNFDPQESKTITTTLWIVLVGINIYQDLDIFNLQYCANDCQELAEALLIATQGFQETKITALYDGGEKIPERGEVITSIQQFRLAKPNDTILFYFSGHSYLDSHNRPVFCVADTRLQDLAATTLPIDILLNEFRQSQAQNQLIWLDACQEEVTDKLLSIFDQQVEQSQKGQNFYAVLSCDKTERSWEFSELKHGLFTYYLIEGLRGKAADNQGRIETENLFRYVKNQISKFIQQRTNLGVSLSSTNVVSRGLVVNPDRSSKSKIQPFPKNVSQTPQRIAKGGGELFIGLATPPTRRKALIVDSLLASEADISLCKLLQAKGGFTVDYCFSPEKQKLNIQSTISRHLRAENNGIVLLYLAGKIQTNNQEEWELITHTNNRINLNWLSQQLQSSAVGEIIMIIDNLGGQETNSFHKTLLPSIRKYCCLMIVCAIDPNKRAFLQQLVKILANTKTAEFWVSELITKLQRWSNSQTDIKLDYWLSGSIGFREILLPFLLRSDNKIFEINVCPYKSLEAFTQDDAYFFHGRDEEIKQIIAGLQATSFIAVVGASGSGKSSLVRAGVIPKLINEGLTSPSGKESLSCKTWVIRPTDWVLLQPENQLEKENSFSALATSLKPDNREFIEGVLYLGVDSFVQWLRQQSQTISVLVIDQFEELFTLTAETDRINFLNIILGALTKAGDCFKVIITLRDDFLKDCLANPQLAPLITQSTVLVPSCLREAEYGQIIKQPAQKVGLTIEEGLVNLLLQELKTESLPLLQFALEGLWHNHTPGSFTLKDYQENIGGLKKILGRKAQETLEKLNPKQKQCAQWIFCSLVQLGEGKEDTRRRLPKSKLLVDKYKDVFDSTLEALIEARLLVVSREPELAQNSETSLSLQGREKTSQEENKNKDKVTVEVAHEILIRDWDTLRWWLDENRDKLRLMRELEQEANQWESTHSSQKDGFLLSEARLAKYEELYVNYQDELSPRVRQFVSFSIEKQERLDREEETRRQKELEQERKARKNLWRFVIALIGGLSVSISLLGFAMWQTHKVQVSQIETLNLLSKAELASNNQLKALLASVKAGKQLQKREFNVSPELDKTTDRGLQQVIQHIQEYNRLEGHSDGIDTVSFSPNGQFIASAGLDNTIIIWSLDGEKLKTLEGHQESVTTIRFSPDSKIIASSSEDKTIKLWNLEGQKIRTLQGHNYGVSSISFSPNGKMIASASEDKTVKLWNLEGEELKTLQHGDWVGSVAFSPNEKIIASGSGNGSIRLWSLEGKLLQEIQAHDADILSISFSPDSQMIASASFEKMAKLWDLNGRLLQTLANHDNRVNSVTFSPDGTIIASASADNTIKLWNLEGEELNTLQGHSGEVREISFSPDGQFFVSASLDRSVRLWKPSIPPLLKTLKGHSEPINSVSFSPDGQMLASASLDKTVKLWNSDGQEILTLSGHNRQVNDVLFISNGQKIVSASQDTTIKFWSIQGEEIKTLQGHSEAVNRLSFSPKVQLFASASDDTTIRLWNLQGEEVKTLRGHSEPVYGVTFSPNGKVLASASKDGTVRLWTTEGKVLNVLSGHKDAVINVSFSPDGQLLASASFDNTVRLWNLEGDLLHTFEEEDKGWVWDVSFSPDGKFLASASEDNMIKIWSLSSYQKLQTLSGHTDRIFRIRFSPKGKLLASASDDKTVKLWSYDSDLKSLNSDEALASACNWLQDYLKYNPSVKERDRSLCL